MIVKERNNTTNKGIKQFSVYFKSSTEYPVVNKIAI